MSMGCDAARQHAPDARDRQRHTASALLLVHHCYELGFAILYLFGSLPFVEARHAESVTFDAVKEPAAFGLAVDLGLYFFAFLVTGGEWFPMWQSGEENTRKPPFRFIGALGLILIFLCLPKTN